MSGRRRLDEQRSRECPDDVAADEVSSERDLGEGSEGSDAISSETREGSDADPSDRSEWISELLVGIDESRAMRTSPASRPKAVGGRGGFRVGAGDRFVAFLLAGDEYAIPVAKLQEIARPAQITPLPRVEPHVLGVMMHRGAVLPVLDLRVPLGLIIREQTRTARILVIDTPLGLTGVLAERVVAVERFEEALMETLPPSLSPAARYMRGIFSRGDRTLIVLDVEEMLASKIRPISRHSESQTGDDF